LTNGPLAPAMRTFIVALVKQVLHR
jgi:hypothetical protein